MCVLPSVIFRLFLTVPRFCFRFAARPLSDNVSEMLARPSISAGLGLIYRFDPVRVEVNFGVPLVASKSDGTRKGIQVGVGLEFL
jgi:outer membrane protein insertion porin family